MSHNSIDYFATLGRKEGELACKCLRPVGVENDDQACTIHPSEVWSDAITDIEVIYKDFGEHIRDSSWELIEFTIDKSSADFLNGVHALGSVYIAVQRRRHSLREDHICDIAVVYMGEDVPDGYEAIEKSISGESFFENGSSIPRTRLAVRRANASDSILINGMPLVDDIVLINRSLQEFEPEDYVVIDRSLQQPKTWGGDTMILAYHRREPLGLCDLKYESVTLDRFPLEDHKGLALPVEELPMFVFPHGLQFKYCKKQSFPLPDFFTFVFTDVHGRHLYTTCLRFYEAIPQADVEFFLKSVYGDEKGAFSTDEMDVFSPKVICVVSQFPFYRAMGRFLKQLYSLSLSPSFFPIEHFIASVVSQIPVPVAGGRPLYVVLDAALISHSSRSMQPIKFELPPKCFFPPMDLDFSGPMRCLSLDNLLAIFCLLLRESKVIFICDSNALLTDVMETFRALLFPLTWSSCFVTRLPDLLSGLLQAPGGFMIGLHMLTSHSGHSSNDKKMPEEDILDKYGTDQAWTSSLQAGTYIVDLSRDSVNFFNGSKTELLSSATVSNIMRVLPAGPLSKLHSTLSSVAGTFKLCPQNIGHAQFDSVFEFQSFDADTLPAGVLWSDFPTMTVRDAFLRFMTDLLGDYSRYITSSPFHSSTDFQTFKELFSVEEYQRDADKSVKTILEGLVETQMFVNLIQERSEVPSHHLLFFDKAVRRLKDLNLSSLVSDSRHNPKYRQQSQAISGYKVDSSVPLYEHIIVLDSRDACFLVDADATSTGVLSVTGSKKNRDLFMGSVTSFEHALSRDDRNDSKDMTVEKRTDRQELVTQLDLSLDDFMKGPLIIPGPLLKERNIDRDGDAPTDQEYLYDTCWPTLNHSITHEVTDDTVRKELRRLREKRKVIAEKVDASCQLFIREECERNCFKFNGRLLNCLRLPIHYDATDSALLTSFPDECKAAISLTASIFNVSLVTLSARALCEVSSTRDIVQALGILSHLDNVNLLHQVDESSWRSLIIASNNIEEGYFKGHLLRLLQDSLHSAGVSPNILTSSQRSSGSPHQGAKGSPSVSSLVPVDSSDDKYSMGNVLDTFAHLEELGLAWFAQKIIPFDILSPPASMVTPSSTPSSYYDSGPKSFQTSASANSVSAPPSTMRRFSNMFRKNTVEQQMPRKIRRKSVKASVASVECANFMQLVKRNSYFSIQRPRGALVLLSVPQILPRRLVDGLNIESNVLTCIKCEDIEGKVHEVRDVFSKIQKLKHGELSAGQSSINKKSSSIGSADGSVVSGRVTVELLKASSLYNCNTQGCHISLATIYGRLWTTSSPHASVKTAPGLQACSAASESHNDVEKSEVNTSVHMEVSNIADDAVFVELYGDVKKDGADSCHLFDQSLGVGHFAVSTVVDVGKKNFALQLFSATEKKTATVHLCTEFTADSAESDSSCRIASQTSMESFFDAQSTDVGNSAGGRPASTGGHSSGFRQHESVKKTWKERLSFGLYKNDRGGHMRGGGVDSISRKGDAKSSSPSSLTPPPSMRQINEVAHEDVSVNLIEDLQSVQIQCDLSDSGDRSEKAKSAGARKHAHVSLTTAVDDSGVKKDGEEKEIVRGDAQTSSRLIDPFTSLRSEIESSQECYTKKMTDLENLAVIMSQEQRGAVGIYSCSPCLVCGFCMLDDEMMASWAGFSSLHGKDSIGAIPPEQDIVKAHAISCVKCESSIVPMLHIQQYVMKILPTGGEQQGEEGVDDAPPLCLLWETAVPYLSPYGVRFSLESMIADNGTEMLKSDWLIKNSPILYWNMQWYATRLDLPSGLIPRSWSQYAAESSPSGNEAQFSDATPLDFFGPIALSWRECTVRARVRHLLYGSEWKLCVADIFPGAAKSELDAAEKIMASVDNTLSGISTALIQCAHLKSLQVCFYESPARGIYLTFLMLVHFYNPSQLVNFQTNNIYVDLSKGALFDRMYRDALSVAFTPTDFETIGLSSEELLQATSSTCALGVRILFGLML